MLTNRDIYANLFFMGRQIIGFEKNKKFFEGLVQNGGLGHAYLFTGQEMIGKRTFALELARQFSLGNQTSQAEIELINNPDVLFINPADSESGQSIAIAEARKIKSFLSLSSYAGQYKVAVIDDAHLLTDEAQNALLKILEDPNPSSFLILVTANPKALLPTILSRCQEIRFLPHPLKIIEEVLADSKLTKVQREFLAEFANGRVGLVKRIVAEDSFGEIEKTIKELTYLARADINERLTIAQKITDEKNRADLARKVLYWQLYMRLRLNEPKAPKILRGLINLQETISQPQFNQRLALENFLISL